MPKKKGKVKVFKVTEKQLQDLMKNERRTGSIAHAEKTLLKKFTEEEFQALLNIFWFSDLAQSIRICIAELEAKIKTLEEKLLETEKKKVE